MEVFAGEIKGRAGKSLVNEFDAPVLPQLVLASASSLAFSLRLLSSRLLPRLFFHGSVAQKWMNLQKTMPVSDWP